MNAKDTAQAAAPRVAVLRTPAGAVVKIIERVGGPPVVFLHSGVGSAGEWRQVFELWPEGHRPVGVPSTGRCKFENGHGDIDRVRGQVTPAAWATTTFRLTRFDGADPVAAPRQTRSHCRADGARPQARDHEALRSEGGGDVVREESRVRKRHRPAQWRTVVRMAGAIALVSLLVAGCSPASGGARTTRSSPPASPTTSVPAAPPTARIVTTTHVSGRMWDVTVDSAAVGAQVKVRLLLPTRFDAQPGRRWPVLYLLHGCCDTYVSWSRSTDIERHTRDVDALVVMPDGGKVGFYSNWRTGPAWETFHLTELGRLLDTTYRARAPRVIAGVSMGGLGALGYAARHPGMFTVAASFSGIVDTRLSDDETQAYLGLVRSQGEDPQALWGDPSRDAALWKAHNPYDLAPRLRGTKLFVSAGDGHPGPLDPPHASVDQTESALRAENAAFAQRLKDLKVDATVDLYGPGTHNWVYWQRELAKAWPLITTGLGIRSSAGVPPRSPAGASRP